MKKLLLLLALGTFIVSCTKDCSCDVDGEYYIGDMQYNVSDYVLRNCEDLKLDTNYQVTLVPWNCSYTCGGRTKRIKLQDAIAQGNIRLENQLCGYY